MASPRTSDLHPEIIIKLVRSWTVPNITSTAEWADSEEKLLNILSHDNRHKIMFTGTHNKALLEHRTYIISIARQGNVVSMDEYIPRCSQTADEKRQLVSEWVSALRLLPVHALSNNRSNKYMYSTYDCENIYHRHVFMTGVSLLPRPLTLVRNSTLNVRAHYIAT